MKGFTYYSIMRPVGPGTCPSGFTSFENYDERKHIKTIDRYVWGSVTYDRELTNDEIDQYELIESPQRKLELSFAMYELHTDARERIQELAKEYSEFNIGEKDLLKMFITALVTEYENFRPEVDKENRLTKEEVGL